MTYLLSIFVDQVDQKDNDFNIKWHATWKDNRMGYEIFVAFRFTGYHWQGEKWYGICIVHTI